VQGEDKGIFEEWGLGQNIQKNEYLGLNLNIPLRFSLYSAIYAGKKI